MDANNGGDCVTTADNDSAVSHEQAAIMSDVLQAMVNARVADAIAENLSAVILLDGEDPVAMNLRENGVTVAQGNVTSSTAQNGASAVPSAVVTQNDAGASDIPPVQSSAAAAAQMDGGCLGKVVAEESVDGQRPGGKHGTVAIGGETYLTVKSSLSVTEGPHIYRMAAPLRGYMILVNNYEFDSELVLRRLGSQAEQQYLTHIFTQLGFKVVPHENISAEKMLRVFQDVSADRSLENHDALIVFIMTHGEKGLLMGSDCHFASVETIVGMFNNYHCPQLIHKPKLFFIQACRGGAFDYGVIEPESAADAVPRPSPVADPLIPILPTATDTLICYSTVEGYISLRNENTGSWFGDAMGKVFVDHACEDDLETLLKRVNNRMLRRDSLTCDRMKQALEIVLRGWRKKLYFNPGIYEC